MVKRLELIGHVFGRLTVIAIGANRPHGGGKARWICKCECGNEVEVAGARLRSGGTKSCGCYRRDRAGGLYRSHGKSKTMEYCMFYDARKRALALNIPFDIEPTDIHIPETCPVFGIKLLINGNRNNRPSLDRVIPSKGYVKSNIRVISFKANRIKSDATMDELKLIVKYIGENS